MKSVCKIYDTLTVHCSSYERKLIHYFFQCLFSELSKFALLLIIFTINKKASAFLFSLAILSPIRWNSGGLHFQAYSTCFISTAFFFYLTVCFLPNFNLSHVPAIIFCALAIFIYVILAPIKSPNRPSISDDQKRKCRMRTVHFAIIFLLGTLFLPDPLNKISYWTIVMQSIQLMIAFVIQPKGGVQV